MILAQADPATDVFVALLQYGPLGLFAIAVMTGLLWAKPGVQRLMRERDEMAVRLDREVESRLETLAALKRAIEQMDVQHAAYVSQVTRELAELRRIIERLEDR